MYDVAYTYRLLLLSSLAQLPYFVIFIHDMNNYQRLTKSHVGKFT